MASGLQNNLHVDVPELLEHLGLPDTPTNRDKCAEAVLDAAHTLFPKTESIIL